MNVAFYNYFSLVPVIFEVFSLVTLLPLVWVLAHVAKLYLVRCQLHGKKVPIKTLHFTLTLSD